MEHHEKKKTLKEKVSDNIQSIIIVLSVLLALIFIVNTVMLSWNPTKAVEKPNPASIELTVITSDCKDCFDVLQAVNSVKSGNVDVKKENTLSIDKAKDLIAKYKIEKIPTIVITGEIDKLSLAGFTKDNDALVFTELKAPYIDALTGRTVGLVSVIQIKDKSCAQCESLDLSINQFATLGIKVVDKKAFDASDSDGKDLIKKYSLTKLPTLIVSKDLSAYPEVAGQWGSFGSIEEDGSYILREVNPPYKDLTTNKVKGLVSLTIVNDSSCNECYDVTSHKEILKRMGIKVVDEKIVDIAKSDGIKVVDSYTITKVPTIILSKEAEDYAVLKQIWSQVGTIEKNGAYVFRNVEVMGTYKDLTTNKTVEPPKQTQAQ